MKVYLHHRNCHKYITYWTYSEGMGHSLVHQKNSTMVCHNFMQLYILRTWMLEIGSNSYQASMLLSCNRETESNQVTNKNHTSKYPNAGLSESHQQPDELCLSLWATLIYSWTMMLVLSHHKCNPCLHKTPPIVGQYLHSSHHNQWYMKQNIDIPSRSNLSNSKYIPLIWHIKLLAVHYQRYVLNSYKEHHHIHLV